MSSPLPQATPRRVQRIAEAAVERARLSVVPRVRRRAPRVPFVTLVSLLLLGGVVGLLMFNTTKQQNAFAATSLEQRAALLTSREQTLRMELEVLRDPQAVAERAQKLGMVPAATPAFLSLEDGKILGSPAPATPESRFDILPTVPKKPAALTPRPRYVDVPAPRERARDAGRGNRSGDAAQGRNGRDAGSDRGQARGDRSAR
jgi:hypothetical protein